MNTPLSKEDIVELGFYMTKDYDDGTQEYQMILTDDTWMELTVDDKEKDVKTISIEMWGDNPEGTSDGKEIFKGRIYNKAELHRELNKLL